MIYIVNVYFDDHDKPLCWQMVAESKVEAERMVAEVKRVGGDIYTAEIVEPTPQGQVIMSIIDIMEDRE